ncbi:hypothetical protein RND71_009055 [Anisodus tanguticus]|uniref:Uncharacterized protein n=1 Tax=Anisodus tanguticus TaxID=243964 RepID=A0AAE1SS28_9SOLA|nr:hypothetical protein RND71_009055 [Anisodus tanguticus]
MAARIALLKYLRVEARPAQLRNHRLIGGSFNQLFTRQFSEEVRGSFLDKDEVRDRVISCVKNFQKVDPSKRSRILFSVINVATSPSTSGDQRRNPRTYQIVVPNAHFQNDLAWIV